MVRAILNEQGTSHRQRSTDMRQTLYLLALALESHLLSVTGKMDACRLFPDSRRITWVYSQSSVRRSVAGYRLIRVNRLRAGKSDLQWLVD
jgi:hypothetical protein